MLYGDCVICRRQSWIIRSAEASLPVAEAFERPDGLRRQHHLVKPVSGDQLPLAELLWELLLEGCQRCRLVARIPVASLLVALERPGLFRRRVLV